MTIVGTKYRPKKPDVNSPRQTFQGFAVGNYDENGTQSQSLNNTVNRAFGNKKIELYELTFLFLFFFSFDSYADRE